MTAERIITGFYTRLRRPAPKFIWFDDPLGCVLACNLLAGLERDVDWCARWGPAFAPIGFKRPSGGQIPLSLWFQLNAQLREHAANLPIHVARNRLGPDFLRRFWLTAWSQLESHIEVWLAHELRGVSKTGAGAAVGGLSRDLVATRVDGFWGGACEGLAMQEARPGSAAARLHELQRACGWWSPRGNAVICSDRPQRIRVDASGRLHGERGAALELSSQHKVYAWHGVPVPADWIERRDALDPAVALGWPPSAQRRAGLEIVGSSGSRVE